MPQMRVIPTSQLFIDPDVQLAFTLEEKRWKAMAANWKPEKLGFLFTVPVLAQELPKNMRNGTPDDEWLFSIVDGRHRFLAGKLKGITAWRTDVHEEVSYQDVAAKAHIKLGYDRDRRSVSSLEHFKVRVMALDEVAVDIEEIVTHCGFRIDYLGGRQRLEGSNIISATSALERYYNALGSDGFRRMIQLDTHWIGQPSSNGAPWLGALALLVRDGYDQALTPKAITKMKEIIPAVALRHANGVLARQGLFAHGGAGGTHGFSTLSYETARYIRRKSGLRQRPVQRSSMKASQSQQL